MHKHATYIHYIQGGFNINHDLEGTFLGPADKMVVTQCREVSTDLEAS